MKITILVLLALMIAVSVGHAVSLDEQIVNAINAGDATNLLSMLTPEARPSEAEAQYFIREEHLLFGTLTATGKVKDMTGVHNAAVLGKEFGGMTLQITDEVKSSKSSDTGLRLVYAIDSKSGGQVNTNALWQIKVEGIASAADMDQWLQWTKHEAIYQPSHTTRHILKRSSGPEVDKEGNIILNTLTDQDEHATNIFVFSISKARFDSQPAWSGGKQPIPVDIDKACQITMAWIDKQSLSQPLNGSYNPLCVIVNQVTLSNHDGCWFYALNFEPCDEGGRPWPNLVLVLLDGSVVEPKALKEGTP